MKKRLTHNAGPLRNERDESSSSLGVKGRGSLEWVEGFFYHLFVVDDDSDSTILQRVYTMFCRTEE